MRDRNAHDGSYARSSAAIPGARRRTHRLIGNEKTGLANKTSKSQALSSHEHTEMLE
jgi:hypothetical protein